MVAFADDIDHDLRAFVDTFVENIKNETVETNFEHTHPKLIEFQAQALGITTDELLQLSKLGYEYSASLADVLKKEPVWSQIKTGKSDNWNWALLPFRHQMMLTQSQETLPETCDMSLIYWNEEGFFIESINDLETIRMVVSALPGLESVPRTAPAVCEDTTG